jgi:hypothetical protein
MHWREGTLERLLPCCAPMPGRLVRTTASAVRGGRLRREESQRESEQASGRGRASASRNERRSQNLASARPRRPSWLCVLRTCLRPLRTRHRSRQLDPKRILRARLGSRRGERPDWGSTGRTTDEGKGEHAQRCHTPRALAGAGRSRMQRCCARCTCGRGCPALSQAARDSGRLGRRAAAALEISGRNAAGIGSAAASGRAGVICSPRGSDGDRPG